MHWLRHCQSEANAGGVPRPDTPLSAAGAAAATALSGEYDVVFTSPMRRARQTLMLSRIEARGGQTLPEITEVVPILREVVSDVSDTLWPGEPMENGAALAARLARPRASRGCARGCGAWPPRAAASSSSRTDTSSGTSPAGRCSRTGSGRASTRGGCRQAAGAAGKS